MGTAIVSALVIIQASMSYLAYGDQIGDLVTHNLPHNLITTILRILYSLGLLFSTPIQSYAAFDIIEHFDCYQQLP